MEKDEIISLIHEICTELLIYDVQGRYYDSASKIEIIGTIYENKNPKHILFFISTKDIIDKPYLDIVMKIKVKINESLA